MTSTWTLPASLDRILEVAAERTPQSGLAIIDRRGNADRRTYPELLDAVNARAGRLAARGLQVGEVVLISPFVIKNKKSRKETK